MIRTLSRLIGVLLTCACFTASSGIAQETTTYSYDPLGRLTNTSISGGANNGVSTATQYDPATNRTNYTVSVAGSGAPGVIPHYSFEQPNVGAGFEYRPNYYSDLYFQGNAGIAGNGSAWAFPSAPAGTQVAFLQDAGSSISTNVSGLTVGATYRVRFKASMRQYFPANAIYVSFQGNALGVHTPTAVAFQQFQTATFVATSSVGVLGFAGQTAGDSGTGIDDLQIVGA